MAYALSHTDLIGPEAEKRAAHRGWLSRLVDAMVESRERAARREIARHQFFVSDTARFMKGVDEKNLPFGA
jgi:hypothetical protein